MRIWIDVEDFFVFAAKGGRRPTGIQRLAFELCQEMRRLDTEGRIGFVRHDRLRDSLGVVAWDHVAALFSGLAEAAPAAPGATPARPGIKSRLRAHFQPMVGRLPPDVVAPLVRMMKAQVEAVSAAADTVKALLKRLRGGGHRAGPALVRGDTGAFAAAVQPGDMLFIPGAGFVHTEYPAFIAGLRARHGLRVALLIYDIIPVRRPEFVNLAFSESFGTWLDGMLPLCDRLMAISRSAAAEATAHAVASGIPLRGEIQPIPIGTGFSGPAAAAAESHGLPASGSYVLFVSTMEPRKNHQLLLRVWRRLLESMPRAEVPILVFAGKRGPLSEDLVRELTSTRFLDGHIRLIDQPSDGDLTALYHGCLFTLFPSFYEGWGLPVTESLAFGKPCIISSATSLPEAGGTLARYFDPEDVPGATALIRGVLEDRKGLAAWTRQVETEFRPVSWQESARAVMEHLT